MIDTLNPMLLDREERTPWSGEGWLFEIKQDGRRMLAQAGALGLQLRTKNMTDCTSHYPEILASLKKVKGAGMVVDGEVIVQDSWGRSDFAKVQQRARHRRWVAELPVVFCVFDVLVNAAKPVMDQPLWKRKRLLDRLRDLPSVLVVDHLERDGQILYNEAVLPLELEGMVAKKRDSLYYPGQRSKEWVKIRRPGAVKGFNRGPVTQWPVPEG